MAIRTVVTRGYGNGTFNGTIALVVTRGYAIGDALLELGDPTRTAYALFQDRRALVPFRDRRAYAVYKDKRNK